METVTITDGKLSTFLTYAIQAVSVSIWGGYYGECYIYGDLIMVLDPGHESQKYARLFGFKRGDALYLYNKYANPKFDGEYHEDPFKDEEHDDWYEELESLEVFSNLESIHRQIDEEAKQDGEDE